MFCFAIVANKRIVAPITEIRNLICFPGSVAIKAASHTKVLPFHQTLDYRATLTKGQLPPPAHALVRLPVQFLAIGATV
jgi:hypothetical protein